MPSNVGVARSVYEAFGQGDIEAVFAAMTDDVHWEEPESSPYGSHVGQEAILQNVLGAVMQDFEEFAAVPEEWIDGGDVVIVPGRYQGKVRATGTAVDIPFIHVWRFRDGKASSFRTSFDTHRWLEGIGAIASDG